MTVPRCWERMERLQPCGRRYTPTAHRQPFATEQIPPFTCCSLHGQGPVAMDHHQQLQTPETSANAGTAFFAARHHGLCDMARPHWIVTRYLSTLAMHKSAVGGCERSLSHVGHVLTTGLVYHSWVASPVDAVFIVDPSTGLDTHVGEGTVNPRLYVCVLGCVWRTRGCG